MNWDPKKIQDCNKNIARQLLKKAIEQSLQAGIKYEELCEIMAVTINNYKDKENK